MITLGVRAHDFGRLPTLQLAEKIADTGVHYVQLALSKAFPEMYESPKMADAPGIAAAFHEKGLQIAVLGCYINPVHPDLFVRERALARFEEHLEWASVFGCSIVGTETGSRNQDCSYHPETTTEQTFRELVSSISHLVNYAEKLGSVIVGIEPVAEIHTVHSPALMNRLLREIDSPALGVIFDPVNLVPKTGVRSQDEFLDECFDSFGSKIVVIHAKDYRISEGSSGPVKSKSLPAGTGELDWKGLFQRLKNIGNPPLPVLMEDLRPEEVPATRDRLLSLWNQS